MDKVIINNKPIYYYESDDLVIDYLVKRKILFGSNNYQVLNHFIKDTQGSIVDCGAHIGTFSFIPAHNNVNMVLIDGASKNIECLKETFKDNANVIVQEAILLDEIKPCTFSSTYGPFGFAKEDEEGSDQSNTLDNILSTYDHPISAIKYDIEGNEISAITGSLKTLDRYKPPLLIEVNGHCLRLQNKKPYDLFDLLDSIGYVYYLPTGQGLLSIDKNAKYPFCVTDIICIHQANISSYNLNIMPSLTQEQIEELLKDNYQKSNEDCKRYFDHIS